ncbi:hypothetical protein RCF27_10245 [Rhodococcus pyridinivorans]|uniref:Uncharacterized protein n=1 Tax=Rhodococcus pyridinivorans TaxID=103816 RepID=A0A7M2XUK4_9NOCA|nr:hypothetical protein [Rhodococcus pyridinivorans]QOW00621.1 hypothetical protein INP59_10050 [Rhodococcus pyridinivorans]WMM74625.1 hypothetical protein RCF27_10245 [Rhodococcus pyridinivorans]
MNAPAPGTLDPADIRRAAALLTHADPDGTNVAGVNVILLEARDAGRITELFLALCLVTYGIVPDLSTVAGKAGLSGIIAHHLALEPNGKPDHE